MVERLVLGLAFLLGYILVGMVVAVYSRKFLRPGEVDFYVASYRLSGIIAALTYASTTYSAFMMVGLVGLAYATGSGALGFELAYLIATLLILTIFAPRVWERARSRGWVSPAEMLSDHYNSKLIGVVVALVYLISLIPYTALQMKGIGEIFSGLVGGSSLSYSIGVLLGALLVIVWSLIAGIWSVALTDALQGLIMLICGILYIAWIILLTHNTIGFTGVTSILSEKGILGLSSFWSIHVFLAYTIPWILFAMIHPQAVQRIYMPRDKGSLANMIRGFALFGFLYTMIAVTIGLLARALAESHVIPWIDPKSRDLVTPVILSIANPILSSLIFTSIIAAAVTTADSIILSLASVSSRDLGYILKPRYRLILGYISISLFTIISALVAYMRIGYIVDLAVLTTVMLLPLAPATLACWLNIKAPAWSTILSIISGFLLVLGLIVVYERPVTVFLLTVKSIPISIIILLVSGIVLSLGIVIEKLRS